MCTICGCNTATAENRRHPYHRHHHIDDHAHDDHWHGDDGSIHFGAEGSVHLSEMSRERIIRLERDILSKNDGYAQANRARLSAARQFALNFVSSPGSGKTALLVRAVNDLRTRFAIAVIEGDQQTSNDADKIRATGAPAVQINTGKGCHLDAHMVGHALSRLPLTPGGLLFIENVGNLVCPAAFDLGEAHKVVVLSVTEGEDKPLSIPRCSLGPT
jgi:hydrogenase nickel incorporation protein HypB